MEDSLKLYVFEIKSGNWEFDNVVLVAVDKETAIRRLHDEYGYDFNPTNRPINPDRPESFKYSPDSVEEFDLNHIYDIHWENN